ncbi:single-stranded DNA-binding protein, partial [Morganella morganii]|uniref:single-stranded DNA-binding protein n=1 Tax=Morganella morganii TaxID=582 RepID=UPI0015F569C0
MAINVITVSGNLGKDCEQRWTPAGKAVASFSLPVKQGYGEPGKTSGVTWKMFGA